MGEGGWRWVADLSGWSGAHPDGQCVCLCYSALHHKSPVEDFLLAPAHPGSPGTRAVKRWRYMVMVVKPNGWDGLSGWLHTKTECPRTVTHLSNNRAWCRVILLMLPTPLPLIQTMRYVRGVKEGGTKKKKKGSAYQTISAVHRVSKISCLFLFFHKVKWCRSNLWSQYDLYVVRQHGALCEVKWWRFVALFEWNWISWFKKMSVLSLS